MSTPSNILVIQTAFIGDVILATALLENLHRHLPTAQITVLVRKGNESLLYHHPFVKRVLVWEKRQQKWKNLFRIIAQVREEKFDAVINLQRFFSTGLVTALSGAKEKIGYRKNPFSFLFDLRVEHQIGNAGKSGLHEVERNQRLIAHLTTAKSSLPKLYPSAADFAAVQKYLGSSFITISPASVWFTKQTPKQVWIDFVSKLDSGTMIYLLGAPADEPLCAEIAKACPAGKIESLAGKLTLLQSAALMSHARMNYTNDSAPMHLCSAMNAPVTAVYCSTIPEFGFGPLSEVSHIVQHKGHLSCRPCGLHGYASCPQKHFSCGAIDIHELLNCLQSPNTKS